MDEVMTMVLPRDWFFTFGHGQPNFGGYVIIHGTWLDAREEMIRFVGMASCGLSSTNLPKKQGWTSTI